MSEGAIVQIIVTLITICVPAAVTLITSKSLRRQANRNFARSMILTMILDDRMRMLNGELPENYRNIHEEYDIYTANNGNSWLHQKIDEYDKAIDDYEKAIKRDSKKEGR